MASQVLHKSPEWVKVPPELINMVSEHLNTEDFCHLRATCKKLEQALSWQFQREFFTTRQICWSKFSVNHLVELSRHPILKTFVKKVIIGFDSFIVTMGQSDNPDSENLRRQLYLNDLENDGGREMLKTAFENLSALREIEFRDFESSRPRPRDGTTPRSWGVRTLQKMINDAATDATCVDSAHGLASRVVSEVVSCLSEAKVQVEVFNMITRYPEHGLSREDIEKMSEAIGTVFDKLTTLMLCVQDVQHVTWTDDPYPGSLDRLFGSTPNLEHLRLNFEESGTYSDALDDDKSYGYVLSHVAMAFAGQNLRRLELGKIYLEKPEPLEELFHRLASTLEHVLLYRIRIVFDRKSAWCRVLEKLKNVTNLLTVLLKECNIGDLKEGIAAPNLHAKLDRIITQVEQQEADE